MVTTASVGPPVLLPPTPAVACRVPRLKGLKLRTADGRLRQAHCRVGRIVHVRSRQVAQGRVVSTSALAGRDLPAGSKVELFISQGR
jgi:beta-lactam-binding protein with PASTA domain